MASTYQRPLVAVYQEYSNLTTPPAATVLAPCIIGPCYHIVDPEFDSVLADYTFLGDYSGTALTATPLPLWNYAGAILDEDWTKVVLRDVQVRVNNSAITSSFDINPEKDNEITFSGASKTAISGVGVQDRLYFTSGSATGYKVITAIELTGAGNLLFTLSDSIPVDATSFYVTKSVEEDKIVYKKAAHPTLLTISSGGGVYTLAFGGGATTSIVHADTRDILEDREIHSAKAYSGYRALRKDLHGKITTISNMANAVSEFGNLTHENPLGLGVRLALLNTTNVEVYCVGTDTTAASFEDALDTISTVDFIYSVVPLTQDISVLSAFKNHVEQNSVPEVGQWRAALINSDHYFNREVAVGSNGKLEEVELNMSFVAYKFSSANSTFLLDGVVSGSDITLNYNADGASGNLTVKVVNVIDDNTITIGTNDDINFNNFNYDTGTIVFSINRFYDRSAQARLISDISSSFGSRRVINVWPANIELPTTNNPDVRGEIVPGYFLCCVLAGMVAGLPSHHGFTRLSGFGGIRNLVVVEKDENDEVVSLRDASSYFTQDQLDTIAGGGTFVFTQKHRNSPIFVRHQLTTDRSAIEFSEFSFVKNFDYVSYLCKKTLDRFLGQYNINSQTLVYLQSAVESLLESQRLESYPKIGSRVLNYKTTSVYQREDQRTRVEMFVDIWFPYALNTIGLHLVSQ